MGSDILGPDGACGFAKSAMGSKALEGSSFSILDWRVDDRLLGEGPLLDEEPLPGEA